MKVSIFIESWKLPIFEKHLTKAGYNYEKSQGLIKDTLVLIVETEDPFLALTVQSANTEAKKNGDY